MTELADGLQRERALDLTNNVLVQAPAGSGKTRLLVDRFLKCLCTVDKPEKVVAITFTRKAAAEMRQRIASELVQDNPSDIARQVLSHNQSRGWDLVNNIARLRIVTIDSFCGSITKALPLTSQLGSGGAPTEDDAALYQEAVYRLVEDLDREDPSDAGLAAVQGALSSLLAWHDNRLDSLVSPLAGLLRSRDQWLPALLRRRATGEASGRAVLELVAIDMLCGFEGACGPDVWPRFVEVWAQRLIDQADAGTPNADNLSDRALEIIRCGEYSAHDPNDAAAIAELLPVFFTSKGFRKGSGLKSNAGGWISKTTSKQMASVFVDEWSQADAANGGVALSAALAIMAFPGLDMPDDLEDYNRTFDEVLLRLVTHLHVVFAERGEVDFLEISQRSIATLEGADDDFDLLEKVDYQIQHLLVDEMQDTASNQIRLLELLSDHWTPGDGHSLFLVGDPMQSIYAFRNADLSLFLDLAVNGRLRGTDRPLDLVCLNLTTNFRSTRSIIDGNNKLFERLLPAQARVLTGEAAYSASDVPPDLATSCVDPEAITWKTCVDAGDGDIPVIASDIEELLKRDSHATIGVLARTKKELRRLIPELQSRGIAYVAEEVDSLTERPESRCALSLVRALWHEADDAAWVAVLRSPLVGLSWGQIHAVHHEARVHCETQGKPLGNWPSRVYLASKSTTLDQSLITEMARFHAALTEVRIPQFRGRVAEQAEALWVALGGVLTLDNHSELANVQTVFSTVRSLTSDGHPPSLDQIVRSLAKTYGVNPSEGARVSLMTIHKSKGLQFDHVLVVGCNAFQKPESKPLLAMLPYENDMLAIPKPDGFSEDKLWSGLYDLTHGLLSQRRSAEATRVAYVAATRPKQTLTWYEVRETNEEGDLKKPANGSLSEIMSPAFDLMRHVEIRSSVESGLEEAQIPTTYRPESLGQLAHLSAANFDLVERQSSTPSDQVMTRRSGRSDGAESKSTSITSDAIRRRLIGDMYHLAMERIAKQGLDQFCQDGEATSRIAALRESMAAGFRRMGLPGPLIPATCDYVLDLLKQTVESKDGRWILGAHDWAETEYALSGFIDGKWRSAIIDRCFLDGDVLWIVDYKTGDSEGDHIAYARQLREYAIVLSQRFDHAEVKAGLFFAQDSRFVELDLASIPVAA